MEKIYNLAKDIYKGRTFILSYIIGFFYHWFFCGIVIIIFTIQDLQSAKKIKIRKIQYRSRRFFRLVKKRNIFRLLFGTCPLLQFQPIQFRAALRRPFFFTLFRQRCDIVRHESQIFKPIGRLCREDEHAFASFPLCFF